LSLYYKYVPKTFRSSPPRPDRLWNPPTLMTNG